MDHQMAFSEFWTKEEIAEYIIRTVNRGKPLELDIIIEWNNFMTERDDNETRM